MTTTSPQAVTLGAALTVVETAGYRVWLTVKEAPEVTDRSLHLAIDGREYEFMPLPGTKRLWSLPQDTALSLVAGQHSAEITISAGRWQFERLQVSSLPEQDLRISAELPSLTPQLSSQTSTSDSAQQHLQTLSPENIAVSVDEKVDSEWFFSNPARKIPEGFPGGLDVRVFPSKSGGVTDRQHLVVPLTEAHDISTGGFVVVYHPGNYQRRGHRPLVITAVDADGREARLQPEWQRERSGWATILLTVPNPGRFDATAVTSLMFSDGPRAHRSSEPFLLAKIVAVAGVPPQLEHAGTYRRTFVGFDDKKVVAKIKRAMSFRRGTGFLDFNPAEVRVLLGDALSTLEPDLEAQLPNAIGAMDPADTSYVDNFFLNNAWLDSEFIRQGKADLKRWQVVVLMTGGVEAETAEMRRNWDAKQLVKTLNQKAIVEAERSGIFSVIALGPTRVADPYIEQHKNIGICWRIAWTKSARRTSTSVTLSCRVTDSPQVKSK